MLAVATRVKLQLSLQLEQLMSRPIVRCCFSSSICYSDCYPPVMLLLLLLQHLLQCLLSLQGSGSSYPCSWHSPWIDILQAASVATAIADLQCCFSSSICYNICHPPVMQLSCRSPPQQRVSIVNTECCYSKYWSIITTVTPAAPPTIASPSIDPSSLTSIAAAAPASVDYCRTPVLLLSSADTAPASVAVLVTAVKIETLAVSAAGTAQFLALLQTSNAILLQQLLQCLLSLPRTRRLQLSLQLDRFSSLIVKRQN